MEDQGITGDGGQSVRVPKHCRPRGPSRFRRSRLLRRIETSEQPVFLIYRPRGEEDRGLRAGGATVAEGEPPEAVDDDRLAVRPFEVAFRLERHRVEHVDAAIAEVADQELAAEAARTRPRDHPH